MSNDSKDELTLRIGEKLTAARIESGYTQSRAASSWHQPVLHISR